jgi:hypothetical protein
MFNILEADIVIMQETKIQKKDLSDEMVLISGWDVYFSLPREKKGMFRLRAAFIIHSDHPRLAEPSSTPCRTIIIHSC